MIPDIPLISLDTGYGAGRILIWASPWSLHQRIADLTWTAVGVVRLRTPSAVLVSETQLCFHITFAVGLELISKLVVMSEKVKIRRGTTHTSVLVLEFAPSQPSWQVIVVNWLTTIPKLLLGAFVYDIQMFAYARIIG